MGVTLSGSQGLSSPQANGYVWLVQEGTTLGKDYIKSVNGCDDLPKIIRLASPRVNGYLVKASSNPLLFFDSPLPGVNTPWDVMRIVSPSASIGFVFLLLLDVALAAAHSPVSILKLTSEDLSRNLKLTVYVVPTGKDNVIVSAGSSKVIPAGRTILVLVVLCLIRVDNIVS
ncbi:hypothetical protein Tco_0053457 [Tanacetum coccineum]